MLPIVPKEGFNGIDYRTLTTKELQGNDENELIQGDEESKEPVKEKKQPRVNYDQYFDYGKAGADGKAAFLE